MSAEPPDARVGDDAGGDDDEDQPEIAVWREHKGDGQLEEPGEQQRLRLAQWTQKQAPGWGLTSSISSDDAWPATITTRARMRGSKALI